MPAIGRSSKQEKAKHRRRISKEEACHFGAAVLSPRATLPSLNDRSPCLIPFRDRLGSCLASTAAAAARQQNRQKERDTDAPPNGSTAVRSCLPCLQSCWAPIQTDDTWWKNLQSDTRRRCGTGGALQNLKLQDLEGHPAMLEPS